MPKKNLIVLGDSHMTPSANPLFKGTHFSEIIADELGYTLIPYCRGGMSNGGIAIALQTALTESPTPNLLLIGFTYPERFEWPWGNKGCRYPASIRDLRYYNKQSISHKLPLAGDDSRIVSAALRDIIDQETDTWQDGYTGAGDSCSGRLSALKQYFEFIYDKNLKRFMDEQIIYSMYHKLYFSGIPFLICRDPMDVYNNQRCKKWLPRKNYAWPELGTIYQNHFVDASKDPGYHTDPDIQKTLAKVIIEKYYPNL